jgi:pimeloyl-ACP methyl ester carboxylesterase
LKLLFLLPMVWLLFESKKETSPEVKDITLSSSHNTNAQLPPTRHSNKRVVWLWRGLLGLLVLIVILALAGATYQAVATANDQRTYLPPGQLMDVGGHKLHIHCIGTANPGSPTVILEAGGGMASPSWAWVQAAVAETTRVCAYDRAGLGWSEPGPTPRDARQVADELHTLLDRAAIAGPYVLVGHSVGGMYVRVYTAQYPDQVTGLVLVDSSHPDQLARSPAIKADQENFQRMLQFVPLLAQFGIVRMSGMLETLTNGLPAQQRAEMTAFLAAPQEHATSLAEQTSWAATTDQTRDAGSLDARPLFVLTAGMESPPDWRMLQAELPALSSQSVQRTVDQATHLSLVSTQEDANATSAAILQVVEAARTGQPLDQ